MATDRELIDAAAKGFLFEKEPFKPLAERFGMSQEDLIARLQGMIDGGKVKRFAASVRHQPMGFRHNAMILARTEKENLDGVGEAACAMEEVSHCYQRSHPDGDPSCVYIMAHEQDGLRLQRVIDRIGALSGIRSIEVCTSLVELKKTSLSTVTTDRNRL